MFIYFSITACRQRCWTTSRTLVAQSCTDEWIQSTCLPPLRSWSTLPLHDLWWVVSVVWLFWTKEEVSHFSYSWCRRACAVIFRYTGIKCCDKQKTSIQSIYIYMHFKTISLTTSTGGTKLSAKSCGVARCPVSLPADHIHDSAEGAFDPHIVLEVQVCGLDEFSVCM